MTRLAAWLAGRLTERLTLEDGGTMFLHSIGNHSPYHTVSYPRRP